MKQIKNYLKNKDDIVGRKVNFLLVNKYLYSYRGNNGDVNHIYECLCDCGNLCEKNRKGLLKQQSVSCGCNLSKTISIKNSKENKYDLSGEYGIGYTSKGEEFYFDLEDYDKIKDYCWTKSQGYIKSYGKLKYKKSIQLHRLIMGVENENDFIVDHIKGFGSECDNRKSNLRIVSKSQNAMNSKIPSTNTSGVKGVSYDRKTNKWRAYINKNKKRIELGKFDNIEHAINARTKAEKIYFGEYAYKN